MDRSSSLYAGHVVDLRTRVDSGFLLVYATGLRFKTCHSKVHVLGEITKLEN